MAIEDAPFPAFGPRQLPVGGELAGLLGPSLQARDGRRVLLQDVDAEVIGIYFSGAYCPPCRMFTPILRTLYLTAQARKKSFEVVFCSADRSSSQYQTYRAEMPWLAIPFENRVNIDKTCRHFGVTGIPCLKLVNRQGQECKQFLGNPTALVRQRGEQFLQALPDRPPVRPGALDSRTVLNGNECDNLTYDTILAELDSAPLDRKQEAFKTLKTITGNLIEHPENAKYRALKKTNKQIQKKVRSPHFPFYLKTWV
ncbi:putative nucleoredoxin [Gregarina niphandrodes]|uniref:Nucleoredoxin n=1 Tax=Gregarina niphandrodes TaxID=110365 RepID=A0A023B6A8_GRENI|nr:putative nucleoredoxin [Gregarina niphandrodes]EZG66186.1 putative nucleoredoxin [Gregarina niphandrodes]|eukprot:XP_011134009.1 putative nucleoredoxin [Gregarina niphandrodes]